MAENEKTTQSEEKSIQKTSQDYGQVQIFTGNDKEVRKGISNEEIGKFGWKLLEQTL